MPTPTNNPSSSTGGQEVQDATAFAKLTERQSMPQTSQAVKGMGKSQKLLIEKVGVVSRVRIKCRIKYKTTASKPKLNPGMPWKWVSQIAMKANGVTGIIDCSGPVLQQRRDRVFRNPVSAVLKGPQGGTTLAESTKYEHAFVLEVPIAHDMESLIGSLLAQNEETGLSFVITWATEEEALTGGAITEFEGEIEWTSTVFSIGSTVIEGKEYTVLPDLSAFHGLIEDETPLVGGGNRVTNLTRTDGQLLCYTVSVVNGAGAKEQVTPLEMTKFAIEYGGNKDPLVWTPAEELLEENADDYNGPLLIGGLYFLAVDQERDNSERDMIIPTSLTELKGVLGIPTGFAASSAQIVTTQETLYPAV